MVDNQSINAFVRWSESGNSFLGINNNNKTKTKNSLYYNSGKTRRVLKRSFIKVFQT
jgi:hypothetical protein